MSLRAEQFRQRADECSRQAEKCPDPSERNHWLKMAEQWLKMAEEEMQISGRRGTSRQRDGALGHIEPASGRRPAEAIARRRQISGLMRAMKSSVRNR